jgi:hypothetical protein
MYPTKKHPQSSFLLELKRSYLDLKPLNMDLHKP